MKTNHNLIAKYLEIIAEQERINQELSESNLRLIKRNNELNRQKNQYRESCKEWKIKHDEIKLCLRNTYETLISNQSSVRDNVKRAIEAYKSNQ